MDTASAETNHARYRALHQRAYRLMVDDAAGIWLYDLVPYLAAHPRIRLTTDRGTWWADLRHWRIPSAERIDRDRIGLGPAAQ